MRNSKFIQQKTQLMEDEKKNDFLRLLREDKILSSRYELLDVIGEGCFGSILKVTSKSTKETFALKIQNRPKRKQRGVLKREGELLARLQGRYGIPQIYQSGEWSQGHFLELQLLNQDLNRPQQYSLAEITTLAIEMLKILGGVHTANILHQDIKPHNMMIGRDGNLFLVDFGLARQIPIRRHSTVRGFVGTPRYASVRAHENLEQSKKDDLESLFYNLAYLYYRRLPWSKLSVPHDQRLDKIKKLKIRHRESLFRQMGQAFEKAFDYIMNLQPYEEPNYQLLGGFFKRSKSLKLDASQMNQRIKVKKISLNLKNQLQIPQTQWRSKESGSFSSSGVASDVILTHLLQSSCGQENYYSDDNTQSILPNTARLSRNLVLKNPFS